MAASEQDSMVPLSTRDRRIARRSPSADTAALCVPDLDFRLAHALGPDARVVGVGRR
jgi:hypothetical protein